MSERLRANGKVACECGGAGRVGECFGWELEEKEAGATIIPVYSPLK